MITSYVSLDLETTGLNPKIDKIIEIGAVKIIDGKEAARYDLLVNPGRTLDERVKELTGIKQEDLINAPNIREVLGEFLEFLEDLPLLGHQILADYSFLKKAAVDQKQNFEKKGIDTLKIARRYLLQLPSRRLSDLCLYYGIEHHAHRALGDALATAALYEKLAEAFYQEGEDLFLPKDLIFKVKRDTPITVPQKERLYRLIELHQLKPEYDVETLTRSEAGRIIDKILFQYGRV